VATAAIFLAKVIAFKARSRKEWIKVIQLSRSFSACDKLVSTDVAQVVVNKKQRISQRVFSHG
jgi:hypothetical protein